MPGELDRITPLRWSQATEEDLAGIDTLATAIHYFDEPAEWVTLPEMREWFSRQQGEPQLVVGREQESVVAVGCNVLPPDEPGTVRLVGAVHPAYRHQGIGGALLAWQLRRARKWYAEESGLGPEVPLRLVSYCDAKLATKCALIEGEGLRPVRWLMDMQCQFPPPRQVREWVETPVLGVRFLPFDTEWASATRDAHNAAFADLWGSNPVGPQEWEASLMMPNSRPEWSWLAVSEADEVVGYALNSSYNVHDEPRMGWTDRIGVRRAWRGRNVGRILLARSLNSFDEAGLEGAGLGIDSYNGRGGELYRSLGYEAVDTIIQYELIEKL